MQQLRTFQNFYFFDAAGLNMF